MSLDNAINYVPYKTGKYPLPLSQMKHDSFFFRHNLHFILLYNLYISTFYQFRHNHLRILILNR